MLVAFDVSETTTAIDKVIEDKKLPDFVQSTVLLDAVLHSLNSVKNFELYKNLNDELMYCYEFIESHYSVEDFEKQKFDSIGIDFELSNIFVSYINEIYEKMHTLPFNFKPKQFQQLTDSTVYAIC